MTTTDAVAPAGTRTTHAFGDELAGFDAVATAEAVRSGALSASEVVRAAIARARAVDPEVHALVVDDFDRAQATADAGRAGPFAGVPTLIKDNTPLANATGAPAISRPLHHDEATNLPVGMMFSAANGQDALLLALGLQIEEAAPWPTLGHHG